MKKDFLGNYFGGDGKYFYLWISKKGKNQNLSFLNLILDAIAKFKATAQQIDYWTGEEKNRRELQSEMDGTRQQIKYEWDGNLYCYIRFNITLL